jgi:hypothetical protein
VSGSHGGGGVYAYTPDAADPTDPTKGSWVALNIPFSSVPHNDTVQAYAPFFDPVAFFTGRYLYVTSTSHGIWVCLNGHQAPGSWTWQPVDAIPFVGAQSISFDGADMVVTTFGGGVWGPFPIGRHVVYTGG